MTTGGMLCVLLTLGSFSPTMAAVLEVPAVFPTIQAAIDAALDGDEIHVASGTYLENLDMLGKQVLLISIAGPEATVIDGSALTRGIGEGSTILCETGEGPLTVIDGFTITGGTGRLTPVSSGDGTPLGSFRIGGGLLALSSNPVVQNCVFFSNDAQFGSGVYFEGGTDALLTNCLFSSNTGLQGSGAYLRLLGGLSTLTDCRFSLNSASTAGGGLVLEEAGALLVGCTFSQNDGILGGGALIQDSVVTISTSLFTANQATLLGGGLLNFGGTLTLTESQLLANNAGTGGGLGADGGTVSLDLCVLAQNSAGGEGGALALSSNPASVLLDRTTVTANSSPNSGGLYIPAGTPSTANVQNSIIHGNLGLSISDSGQTQATYSNIEGGRIGVGNLNIVPLFVDATNGDYSLTAASPMIDAGDPLASLDADGSPRDLGGIPFDKRPDPIAPFDCLLADPCDNVFNIAWSINDAYDAIDLEVDGVLLASLPGDQLGAVLTLTPGPHTICLTPRFEGFVGEPTCCQVAPPALDRALPVTDLTCNVDEQSCTSTLTWTNQDAYSSLEVIVDGVSVLTLPPTATTAIVQVASGTLSLIEVTGISECGGLPVPPTSCESGCQIDFEPFQRGDANADSALDVSDALTMLGTIFDGVPLSCEDAADANDDGAIDVSDVVTTLNAIFGLAPLPGAPTIGTCGTDPSVLDPLNCVSYLSCP